MGNVTKDFSFKEFLISDRFPELIKKVTLTELDKFKIYNMCAMVLQPFRDFLKLPVQIISGKRSLELNKAIAGAENSDHLFNGFASACDFTFLYTTPVQIFDVEKFARTKFAQLIFYTDKKYKTLRWVHLSMLKPTKAGVLTIDIDGVKTSYPRVNDVFQLFAQNLKTG